VLQGVGMGRTNGRFAHGAAPEFNSLDSPCRSRRKCCLATQFRSRISSERLFIAVGHSKAAIPLSASPCLSRLSDVNTSLSGSGPAETHP
jgi:hypothetical protein